MQMRGRVLAIGWGIINNARWERLNKGA